MLRLARRKTRGVVSTMSGCEPWSEIRLLLALSLVEKPKSTDDDTQAVTGSQRGHVASVSG